MCDTPQVFPTAFGPDVTVRDLDLDCEEFVGGGRLTTERAAALADSRERRGAALPRSFKG